MSNRGEMLCAWTGPLSMLIFIPAWIFGMEWLVPPSPEMQAAEVQAMYSDNQTGLRIGSVLLGNFGGSLTVVFMAVLAQYMLKMKGPSPALAWSVIACGAVNALVFIIPGSIIATVAFRLDRAPEIMQFGHDLSWLIFDLVVGPTQLAWLALGLAILWDKSERPLFPRWFAYFNIYGAVLIFLNNMIVFFKVGPFAWNGLLGWWPGACFFCLWFFVSFYVLRKAIILDSSLNSGSANSENFVADN